MIFFAINDTIITFVNNFAKMKTCDRIIGTEVSRGRAEESGSFMTALVLSEVSRFRFFDCSPIKP